MATATVKVCSEQFRDTDIDSCGCGQPKQASHQRCKKCRQKASRNAHLEEIRSKDRIRKATSGPIIPVMSDEEITAHVTSYLNFRCREIQTTSPRGAPGPWIHSVFVENKRESRARLRAKVNVSSRPQVASALKPWAEGFLSETKDQFLREKRAVLLKEREIGVPVDMSQESDEVKQWRDEKAKRQSVVLGELTRAEARKVEAREEEEKVAQMRLEARTREIELERN